LQNLKRKQRSGKASTGHLILFLYFAASWTRLDPVWIGW